MPVAGWNAEPRPVTTSRKSVSYKQIAQQAGVTAMTVSLAMRNSSSISERTRQRIRRIADDLGYRPDPKLNQLMRYMSHRKKHQDYPVICFLDLWETRGKWQESLYVKRLYEAARRRADSLGFRLESFWLNEPHMTARRLSDILRARGILGVMVPPLPPYLLRLPFPLEDFCVVTTSYSAEHLGFHLVTSNRHQIVRLAIAQLRERGYRRLGLVIDEDLDRRSNHDVVAHFMFYQSRIPASERVDILLGERLSPEEVCAWYERTRPEVILSMKNDVFGWLRVQGVSIPGDVGFVSLSNAPDYPEQFAGVDERSDIVGEAAVDVLTAHLMRNEAGRPGNRKLMLLEGVWQDGVTL